MTGTTDPAPSSAEHEPWRPGEPEPAAARQAAAPRPPDGDDPAGSARTWTTVFGIMVLATSVVLLLFSLELPWFAASPPTIVLAVGGVVALSLIAGGIVAAVRKR